MIDGLLLLAALGLWGGFFLFAMKQIEKEVRRGK